MKSLEERQKERAERKADEAKARDASGTGLNDPATSDGSAGKKGKTKAAKETDPSSGAGTDPNAGGANPAGGNGGGTPFPAQ